MKTTNSKKTWYLFLALGVLILAGLLFIRMSKTTIKEDLNRDFPATPLAPLAPTPADSSHNSQGSQKTSVPTAERSSQGLDNFLKKHASRNYQILHDENGKVQSILDGYFVGQGRSAEVALQFSKSLATEMGVAATQIVDKSVPLVKTGTSQVRTFSQVFKGLAVFGAFLKIHSDESGSVFAVNSNLYEVPETQDVRPTLTAEEAKKIAKSQVSESYQVKKVDPELQIYAVENSQVEPVWLVHVSQQESGGGFLALVGAQSGRIRYEYPDSAH